MAPKVSVSIVTYNNGQQLHDCVEGLFKYNTGCDLSVYIIDNYGLDNVRGRFSHYPVTIIDGHGNIGFGKGHNLVLDMLESDYHAVINPDIQFTEDTLTALCRFLSDNTDTVMVTPKMLNVDGSIQGVPRLKPSFFYLLSGRVPGLKWIRNRYTMANRNFDEAFDIEFCTGCFFMMPTEIYKKLGGFDPRFFMYFEDTDITHRAAQLGRVQYAPVSSVTHAWNRTSKHNLKYLFIHIKAYFQYIHKWGFRL